MEEKLEVNFKDPLLGLLVMSLERLEVELSQKNLTPESSFNELLSALENFETDKQLSDIQHYWEPFKSQIHNLIHKFTRENGWSKDLVESFLLSIAFFDFLTLSDSLLTDLEQTLESQEINNYQQLIVLMKQLASRRMSNNYSTLLRWWLPLFTNTSSHRVPTLGELNEFRDFDNLQPRIWQLLTTPRAVALACENWHHLLPLLENEAILAFVDFFELNLELVDDESHLRALDGTS